MSVSALREIAVESKPDSDAIAEEAVGQKHDSVPPDAGKKAEISQEEIARLATSLGTRASIPEKTAESVGERVGDAYSDPDARKLRAMSQERGLTHRLRSMGMAGDGASSQSSEQWLTTMLAGFALGYVTAALVHRRR
jgi:hypothetical protein